MGQSYLQVPEHIPRKARYPVIDAHNHLWGDWDAVAKTVRAMDAAGVRAYCDLTGNLKIKWIREGYEFSEGTMEDFFTHAANRYPGRFYCFTTATFCSPVTEPLYSDPKEFVEKTIALLRSHVKRGALGLKILKELGLKYRTKKGDLIRVDDEDLAPIWEEAGSLHIPVLIHQSDPYGLFQPFTPQNEHYENLKRYTSWQFHGPEFPSKEELLERRDNLLKNHPSTTFLLPHVANYAENLGYVSELLDKYPNVFIDFSARVDELGRQPYTARDFFIHNQDRIYFGIDMPASPEVYRFYFRFLETKDEYFDPPGYDGLFSEPRWRVYGLGLPDDVLEKIYYKNILKIIPNLKDHIIL